MGKEKQFETECCCGPMRSRGMRSLIFALAKKPGKFSLAQNRSNRTPFSSAPSESAVLSISYLSIALSMTFWLELDSRRRRQIAGCPHVHDHPSVTASRTVGGVERGRRK